MNLTVNIGGIRMKNPVMTASGTFGYGQEYAQFVDLNKLGAIVVKSTSLEPKTGNPPGRMMETPCGMLNAIGLENKGVYDLIENKLPFLRQFATPTIISIAGNSIAEFAKLAEMLNEAVEVSGLEINVSCPNVHRGAIPFGSSPEATAEVTKEVRQKTKLPIIVKLSPNVADIAAIAKAAENAGADAISAINTLRGMAINIKTRKPYLSNVTGGLSGPCIRPVAIFMVHQICKAVKIPVVGIGGIMTADDAVEFIIAGASAVGVGTANFVNPCATIEVIEGIKKYLQENKVQDINELIGSVILP